MFLLILSVLFKRSYSLNDIQNHPRIVNEDVGEVVRCSFISLYGSSNGAAIYINSPSSYSLGIKKSCFRSCVTSDQGGCIFFISKSLQIVESGFELCYIHKAQDELPGNVMYVESSVAVLNETSYLKCGPDISVCADSTILMWTSAFLASQMNCTECCSTGGTSGFAIIGMSKTGEYNAEYLNIVNGTVYYCIAVSINYFTANVKSSNYITSNILHNLFYSVGLLNIIDSFIWAEQYGNVVSSENNVKFDNCWGNVKYATPSSYQSIKLEENEVWLCGAVIPYCKPDYRLEVRKIKIVAALLFLPLTGIGPISQLRINFDSL